MFSLQLILAREFNINKNMHIKTEYLILEHQNMMFQ